MKRVLGLTMAGILMFSATAFGATVDEAATTVNVPVLEKAADGKFDVTFGDTKTNNEYMLWVVKGVETTAANVSFTQANVMYIDQVTATAGGASFNDFLPMKSVDSTVLITGQGMNAPVIVGYIKAEGNTITGQISLQGRSQGELKGIIVTFTSGDNEYSAETNELGEFKLDYVADGTYKMRITKAGYLSYTDKTFEISSETVWSEKIQLLAGDINEDDVVDYFDLQPLLNNYDNEGAGDINEDGVVDYFDLQPLLSNYDAFAQVKQ